MYIYITDVYVCEFARQIDVCVCICVCMEVEKHVNTSVEYGVCRVRPVEDGVCRVRPRGWAEDRAAQGNGVESYVSCVC